MSVEIGFKKLTPTNWVQIDHAIDIFARLERDGPHTITPDMWVQSILEAKICEDTPIEIHRLFEVARGAMVYGCFFYPLFTLGVEQMYRVIETATVHKCGLLKASKKIREGDQETRIKWLAEKNVISYPDVIRLDAVRHLRNYTSHPKDQSIDLPGRVVKFTHDAADIINSLFCNANTDEIDDEFYMKLTAHFGQEIRRDARTWKLIKKCNAKKDFRELWIMIHRVYKQIKKISAEDPQKMFPRYDASLRQIVGESVCCRNDHVREEIELQAIYAILLKVSAIKNAGCKYRDTENAAFVLLNERLAIPFDIELLFCNLFQ